MRVDQAPRFGIDDRPDGVGQMGRDDLADPLHLPARTELADLLLDLFHLIVVSAAEPEHDLGKRTASRLRSADQAVPVERWHKGQRARPRD